MLFLLSLAKLCHLQHSFDEAVQYADGCMAFIGGEIGRFDDNQRPGITFLAIVADAFSRIIRECI